MWRKKKQDEINAQTQAAEQALRSAQEDYLTVRSLRPEVARRVAGHLRLQSNNHFQERVGLAFRGQEL